MRFTSFLPVLLSLVACALVDGAPSGKQQGKVSAETTGKFTATSAESSGKLSETLLGGGHTKAPTVSQGNNNGHSQEDLNSRRAKMINYYGYYPAYFGPAAAAGPALGPQSPFMAPYQPQLSDFYQFPYGTIAPVYSYNGLLNGVGGGPGLDGDDSYENDEQSSTSSNELDSNEGLEYDEDIFSRANRRRPSKGNNSHRNSPIFYIRLPPTPYMFIRGLGYISNPPTIQPLPTPVPQFNYNPNPYQNPYMSNPSPYLAQPPNPFINVPVNYVSNAKPVGVYQYQSGFQAPPMPPPPPSALSPSAAAGLPMRFPISAYGQSHITPIRQRPSYGGSAASASSSNNAYNNPDSKITHLKGPFIFNGRPEDIYLLQNLQTTPYNANFFHGYY